MTFTAELKQCIATSDPTSSFCTRGGWQSCSKRQGNTIKYNEQQQELEQGLGKHAHDKSTLKLGCTMLFFIHFH